MFSCARRLCSYVHMRAMDRNPTRDRMVYAATAVHMLLNFLLPPFRAMATGALLQAAALMAPTALKNYFFHLLAVVVVDMMILAARRPKYGGQTREPQNKRGGDTTCASMNGSNGIS